MMGEAYFKAEKNEPLLGRASDNEKEYACLIMLWSKSRVTIHESIEKGRMIMGH